MRWWSGVKLLLFITCRDAAPRISQAMDRTLPLEDRAAVGAHLAICPACRRYRGQLAMLRRVLLLVGMQPSPAAGSLPPDVRERIRAVLERGGGTQPGRV